nr:apple-like protein [Tanacetum cinerariifolium]
ASGTTITIVNECGFTVWPGISSTPDWLHLCGGEMECNGSNYTQPVTVAQLNVTTDDVFYDVSILNGFNIPMTVEPSHDSSCEMRGCIYDLNQRCPSELKLEAGVGCRSCEGSFCQPNYWWLFKWACPKAIFYESDSVTYQCWDTDYTVRFCPPSNTFSTIKLGRQYTGGPNMLLSSNGIFRIDYFGYMGSDINSFAVLSTRSSPYIWAANWKQSSSPGAATLSIDRNTGNLIVTEGSKIVLRITNVQAGPNPNVTATLEDNGNFRLINVSNKRVLWESFDYPESKSGCMKDSTNLRKCKKGNYTISHDYVSFDPRTTNSTTDSNASLGMSDCFIKCWNECNCVGFNSSNFNQTGCTMFFGSNSLSHSVVSSYQAYVISSNNPNPHKNGMHLIWILIGTAVAIVLLCVGILWCHNKRKQRHEDFIVEEERRKRDEYFLELTASESFKDMHQLEGDGGNGNDLLVFSVASIMAATNDFSDENKLGQGGF